MRGLKGIAPLLLIGTAGLAWLLFLSEPGSHWLTSFLAPPPSISPVIGRIVSANGSLKRIHGGDVIKVTGPLASAVELLDGDRLEIDYGSDALIILNSQDEIGLLELTAVTFQLWNEQDAFSPIYMTLKAGEIQVRKAGTRGRAYVVQDGRLYLPGQKTLKKPMALTVLRSAPLDMELELAENQKGGRAAEFEADTRDAESSEPEAKPAGSAAAGIEPETLSNEYIDETIASHQGQLQKCWISRIKDRPKLSGQLVLQFEISRRGRIKELKVADSSVEDDGLQKCVMSVVERIQFRTFKGPEIALTYPIRFE